ncbi:hypothetical protein K470DRAFT_107390 [Piedraia hortae CBS 480.64]|uniref:Uncharacterized protein n=1 Tax=Piedraia hortae CBS 480.64 TaxID=1314780 RepID=A0A6A7BXH5_9PEZI|nr:hypothetical protein K470DRAFT_107390 [Piedraia hortae CBS 480.64]
MSIPDFWPGKALPPPSPMALSWPMDRKFLGVVLSLRFDSPVGPHRAVTSGVFSTVLHAEVQRVALGLKSLYQLVESSIRHTTCLLIFQLRSGSMNYIFQKLPLESVHGQTSVRCRSTCAPAWR